MNRKLQKEILERLDKTYGFPENRFIDVASEEGRAMLYLSEHGLIKTKRRMAMGQGAPNQLYNADITAQGIDFLLDDGGLSAILGVVTIKFHEDTLKTILEAHVQNADLPREEKSRIMSALRQAPADAIKHLTMRLLDKALEKIPEAIQLIETALR